LRRNAGLANAPVLNTPPLTWRTTSLRLIIQLPPRQHAGGNLGWIPGDVRRAGPDRRLPLHNFLRLMAGARMADRPMPAGTNDDLVAHLRKTGAIKQCASASTLMGQNVTADF